jgi:hypothetical protein
MTAASFLGYGALLCHQVDDFEYTLPLKPALHAGLAYTGATAVVQGVDGHLPRPPEAPIDARPRRITGGASIPDS